MLGERIKHFRTALKISQTELGNRLGVSQQAVGKWECNKAEPDVATIQKMCVIFDIPLEMLTGTARQQPSPEDLLYLGVTKAAKEKGISPEALMDLLETMAKWGGGKSDK